MRPVPFIQRAVCLSSHCHWMEEASSLPPTHPQRRFKWFPRRMNTWRRGSLRTCRPGRPTYMCGTELVFGSRWDGGMSSDFLPLPLPLLLLPLFCLPFLRRSTSVVHFGSTSRKTAGEVWRACMHVCACVCACCVCGRFPLFESACVRVSVCFPVGYVVSGTVLVCFLVLSLRFFLTGFAFCVLCFAGCGDVCACRRSTHTPTCRPVRVPRITV